MGVQKAERLVWTRADDWDRPMVVVKELLMVGRRGPYLAVLLDDYLAASRAVLMVLLMVDWLESSAERKAVSSAALMAHERVEKMALCWVDYSAFGRAVEMVDKLAM